MWVRACVSQWVPFSSVACQPPLLWTQPPFTWVPFSAQFFNSLSGSAHVLLFGPNRGHKDFTLLRTPTHVNNMQRNSASYKKCNPKVLLPILFGLLYKSFYRRRPILGASQHCLRGPGFSRAFLQGCPHTLSSALACEAPLTVTAELLFRRWSLSPSSQTANQGLSHDPGITLCPQSCASDCVTLYPLPSALRCVH